MAVVKANTSNMGSKSSQKAMQLQIHGDSPDESDDLDSSEEMDAESEDFDGSEEGSVEENSNLSDEDGEDGEDDEASNDAEIDEDDGSEDGSVEEGSNLSDEEDGEDDDTDEEMDSLDGDADVGDWMEVDDGDSDQSTSTSDEESNDKGQAGRMEENNYGDPRMHGNAGWADAMAKILRTSKPKGKKSIVLAKAKKLSQINASEKSEEKKEEYGFEIDGEAAEENDVKPKLEDVDVKPDIVDSKFKVKRRDLLADGKVKPTILSRERERALNKIATKGVVQLFNAVRDQQKDIGRKVKLAHGSIRKEDKIIKSLDKQSFLDTLMGNARSERVEDHIHTKPEKDVKMQKPENPTTWNVLRDNFLTGSNMKDWDKCGEIKLEEDVDEVELN